MGMPHANLRLPPLGQMHPPPPPLQLDYQLAASLGYYGPNSPSACQSPSACPSPGALASPRSPSPYSRGGAATIHQLPPRPGKIDGVAISPRGLGGPQPPKFVPPPPLSSARSPRGGSPSFASSSPGGATSSPRTSMNVASWPAAATIENASPRGVSPPASRQGFKGCHLAEPRAVGGSSLSRVAASGSVALPVSPSPQMLPNSHVAGGRNGVAQPEGLPSPR
eukprot:jgi/Mesen1/3659/ME000202S02749